MLDELKINTVSEYIPEEEEAHEDFRITGGEISEAGRVKITKEKFGVKLKKAYDPYVEMKAIEHGPDELLEKRWGRFITVLEKVGGAVGPEVKTGAVAKPEAAVRQQDSVQDKKRYDKDERSLLGAYIRRTLQVWRQMQVRWT
jgi:hypothetical protein